MYRFSGFFVSLPVRRLFTQPSLLGALQPYLMGLVNMRQNLFFYSPQFLVFRFDPPFVLPLPSG